MWGRNLDPSVSCSLTDHFQPWPPWTLFALNQTSERLSGCFPYFPNMVPRAAQRRSPTGAHFPQEHLPGSMQEAQDPSEGRDRRCWPLPWGWMPAHIGDDRRNMASCSLAPFIPTMQLWGCPRPAAGTPQFGAWVWMGLILPTDLLSPPAWPRKACRDTVPKTTSSQKNHDLPPYRTTTALTLPRCTQYFGKRSPQIIQSPRALNNRALGKVSLSASILPKNLQEPALSLGAFPHTRDGIA